MESMCRTVHTRYRLTALNIGVRIGSEGVVGVQVAKSEAIALAVPLCDHLEILLVAVGQEAVVYGAVLHIHVVGVVLIEAHGAKTAYEEAPVIWVSPSSSSARFAPNFSLKPVRASCISS